MVEEKHVRETRPVDPFKSVVLEGFGQLVIQQGDQDALVIEADEDLISKISTKVIGETLQLKIKREWFEGLVRGMGFFKYQHLKYLITMKEIQRLDIAGSGQVRSEQLKTGQLAISVHGQGDIELENFFASQLSIEINGQGKMFISGEVKEQNIFVSGSGEVDLSQVKNQQSKVKITGNGTVKLSCDQELSVIISGLGKVYYSGSPKVSQKLSGMGELFHLD